MSIRSCSSLCWTCWALLGWQLSAAAQEAAAPERPAAVSAPSPGSTPEVAAAAASASPVAASAPKRPGTGPEGLARDPARGGQASKPGPRWALDDERPPRRETEAGSYWYGWQTLTVDAISLALSPLGVGVLGFWFGTPIVHEVHGNYAAGIGSALLRVTNTLLPAWLWMASCFELNLDWGGDEDWSGGDSDVKGHNAFCDVVLPAWAIVGALGSITLDAAVLAYDDAEPRERADVGIAPFASARGDGGLALHGRF
jgi:hypothetical protein